MYRLLILAFLFPVISFSQVIIKPGQSTVVTAEPCPSPTTIIIRDTIWQCPPTPPVVVPPPSIGYSLSYSNDYDQPSDINSNQLGIGKQTVFEGRGVFWSEYKPGGAQVSSGYRSEQEYNLRYYPTANPIEGKLSVEMYFKDYKVQGRTGHCLQWHPNNNRSALFLLGHTEGKFNFARSIDGVNFYQSGNLKAIESNKWYLVEVEFRWSGGSDGYIRAYVDGVLCMSYTGRTQDSSGQPYLKVGQNYFNSSVGGIVLYDNLAVYKKL